METFSVFLSTKVSDVVFSRTTQSSFRWVPRESGRIHVPKERGLIPHLFPHIEHHDSNIWRLTSCPLRFPGWSVWLSDRREILKSIYRGGRPWGSTGSSTEDSIGGLDRGFYRGVDGRLDRGARPGGSAGGSMEGSTGEFVRVVLPRGARHISETGGFYRGVDGRLDQGTRPGGSTGGFYREVLPGGRWNARSGGSTGSSMEGSTGGSTGCSTEDSIGRLDWGVLPGGSVEGSTGRFYRVVDGRLDWGTRPGGSTGVLPKGLDTYQRVLQWSHRWPLLTCAIRMDFDLETMDSVRVGPFGQVFWPDHIVFGHTGAGIIWRRDAASFIWTRLSYQELTTLHDSIKQCCEFHYLGGKSSSGFY